MSSETYRSRLIRQREAIEHPLDVPKVREVWRVSHEKGAYQDQLGLKHSAWVVHERLLLTCYAQFEQFEYYGEKWYLSGLVAKAEDGREFRYYANLVDYTGGGAWREIDPQPLPSGIEAKGFWRSPPWSPEGEDPKGYMLPDGSPASRLSVQP